MQGTAFFESSKVVKLADWRAAHAAPELPLFARAAQEPGTPGLEPARVLRPRDVAHRERMLSFLRSTS